MCSSKTLTPNSSTDQMDHQIGRGVARINGRPVLQPTCNRVPSLERRNSIKKTPLSPPSKPKNRASVNPKVVTRSSPSPPISPKITSPKQLPIEKVLITPFKSCVLSPGSIASARREQVANMQEMRKMRIAHYGRKKTSIQPVALAVDSFNTSEKRCSFITPNSDPIYVEYHDEEWGVPVYDDSMLFELLVLTTAQIGSNWTSVLKKRLLLRDAFAGFDAQVVANFGERKMTSISNDYDLELCQVRGAVDNANQILKIQREFGSFSNYLWRYVKNKPINSNYKTWQKVPVKTSKSEAISKDLVKRGLRFVGPAVIHSFMQTVGLSNDHLISCPRHRICNQLGIQ